MNTKQICELKEGQEFKTTAISSPVYVRMYEKDGKIGYRHKVTDFQNKPHFYSEPTKIVIPVN